jgi:WD40 repeat protein
MSALDDDYTLRLWNVNNEIVQELIGYSGPIAFSPDGTARALCLGDGRVKLWGAVSKTLEVGQPLAVTPRSKRHY